MFSTCIPTIYVSDMDRSVRFYTEVLGLKLAERYGNEWASVEAGSVRIGLHPASARNPAGRNGSMTIGFLVVGSLEGTVRQLEAKGVSFPLNVQDDKEGKSAVFSDPDGHGLYLYQVAEYSETGWQQAAEYQQS